MGLGLTTSYETSGCRNNPNGIRPANQRGSHTHVQFNGDHREGAAANEGGPTGSREWRCCGIRPIQSRCSLSGEELDTSPNAMDFAFYGEVSVCLRRQGADRGLLSAGWHSK